MNENKRKALDLAAQICREFEGFVAKPYLCPANYWTQGYGTVNKPDGTVVKPTDPPISKQTADLWLVSELENVYMAGVLARTPNLAKYPEALGAITSFAYNLGVPRYRSSTLARRILEESWLEAQREIKKWTRAGGKILPGLVRRRLVEAQYLKGA
jgi:lysozyme